MARTLQGLGASATMAVNTALIRFVYPSRMLGRGFGHNAMVICGIGFGFFQTPNMRAIMTSAPPHRGGSANSIVATGRLIGQTIGAAFAALCFSLAGRDGAVLALAAGAGFAGLGGVMSFLRLTVAPRA